MMMYTSAVVLLLIIKSIQLINANNKYCDVNIKELPVKQPLYLINGGNVLFPSTHDGKMQLKGGDKIELFCAGPYDNPNGLSNSQVLTCVDKKLFSIGGTSYDITKINCTSPINAIIKTGTYPGMYEIAFNVSNRFIKQLEIYFDNNSKMALYVKHNLLPGSFSTTNQGVAIDFTATNDVYGMTTTDMKTIYRKKTQGYMITSLLGVPSTNYIDTGKFLARGHLASRADFLYINEQRATFSYMNAAPQWQTFNAGNWFKIEESVRKYLRERQLNRLDIYTGVHDYLTLPNAKDVLTKLYLHYTALILPVPKFFYKIVINPITRCGVAIIGINNPYLIHMNQINGDYMICTDISSQLPWLNKNDTELTFGYTYACEVSEFIRRNPGIHLPTLHVTSLLR